mmetsp:Transcript_27570/g.27959  ORF Transcript_27570/g.27959 Transcript_27570/m.27959 type:complete len:85 (-) Transcript_27570:28-282(-)
MVKDEFSLLQNCIMIFIIHIVNISSNTINYHSFVIELEKLIEDAHGIVRSRRDLYMIFRNFERNQRDRKLSVLCDNMIPPNSSK